MRGRPLALLVEDVADGRTVAGLLESAGCDVEVLNATSARGRVRRDVSVIVVRMRKAAQAAETVRRLQRALAPREPPIIVVRPPAGGARPPP